MTTKKTLAEIAKSINETRWRTPFIPVENARHAFACSIADALEMENPRFDRSRFIKACTGMTPEDTEGR